MQDRQLTKSPKSAAGASSNEFDASKLMAGLENLQRLTGRLLHGEYDEDDVRQEILRRALSNPPQNVNYQAWIKVVARSVVVDLERKRTRRRAREAVAAIDHRATTELEGVEQAVIACESSALIQATIDALGPTDADLIRMRFFEGLKTDAIAKKLGVKPETVLRREKHALASLRRQLRPAVGCLAAFSMIDVHATWLASTETVASTDTLHFIVGAGGVASSGPPGWVPLVGVLGLGAATLIVLLSIADPTPSVAAVDAEPNVERPDGGTSLATLDALPAPVTRTDVDAPPNRPTTPSQRPLRVRVVDTHGAPLPGAAIRVSPDGLFLRAAWIGVAEDGVALTAFPPGETAFHLEARADGRGTIRNIIRTIPEARPLTVVLSPSRRLSGLFLTSDGEEIVDGWVATTSWYDEFNSVSETRLDKDGRFELDVIGRSELVFSSSSHGVHRQPVRSHIRDVGTIRVNPRDSAPVRLELPHATGASALQVVSSRWLPPSVTWIHAVHGTVLQWPNEEVRLRCYHDAVSYRAGQIERTSTPSSPRHITWDATDLPRRALKEASVVQPSLTLTGTITLSGQPLWGGTVYAVDHNSERTGGLRYTDEEGRFSLPVGPSIHRLHASGHGHSWSREVTAAATAPGVQTRWNVELPRTQPPPFSGRLTDERGGTVTGDASIAFFPDVGRTSVDMTLGDGTFQASGRGAESAGGYLFAYTLEAFGEHTSGASDLVRVNGEQHDVELVLKPTFFVPVDDIVQPAPFRLHIIAPNGNETGWISGQMDPSKPYPLGVHVVPGSYRLDFRGRKPLPFSPQEGDRLLLPPEE